MNLKLCRIRMMFLVTNIPLRTVIEFTWMWYSAQHHSGMSLKGRVDKQLPGRRCGFGNFVGSWIILTRLLSQVERPWLMYEFRREKAMCTAEGEPGLNRRQSVLKCWTHGALKCWWRLWHRGRASRDPAGGGCGCGLSLANWSARRGSSLLPSWITRVPWNKTSTASGRSNLKPHVLTGEVLMGFFSREVCQLLVSCSRFFGRSWVC